MFHQEKTLRKTRTFWKDYVPQLVWVDELEEVIGEFWASLQRLWPPLPD